MKPSRKATVLRALTDYFLEKGEILDKVTYAKQPDTPVPPRIIKRLLGNWNRLPRMIKVNFSEDYNKIMGIEEPVVENEPTAEELQAEAEQVAKSEAAKALLDSLKSKIEGAKDEE